LLVPLHPTSPHLIGDITFAKKACQAKSDDFLREIHFYPTCATRGATRPSVPPRMVGIGPPRRSARGSRGPGGCSAVAEADLGGERRAEKVGGERAGVVSAGREDDAHAADGAGIGRLLPVTVEVPEGERPHAVDHRLRAGAGVPAEDVVIQLPA